MPAPILSAPQFFPSQSVSQKEKQHFFYANGSMVQNKDLGFFGITVVDNDQIEKVHD